MNRSACILLLLSLALQPARAAEPDLALSVGDTLVFGLNDAVSLALDESFQAQTLAMELSAAGYSVDAARGRFRTRADLDLLVPNLVEQVQGQTIPGELPRYDSYGHREISALAQVTQPLPTDGALSFRVHAYEADDSVYNPALDAEATQSTYFSSYEIAVQQPLFQPNSLKLGLENAEISHRLASRAYTRGRLDLDFNVTAVFFDLYRAQQELTIARDMLVRQRQNRDLADRKYAAGLIPEVEALQMEVDLAESRNSLLAAEAALILHADRFRLLVGLPMRVPVAVASDTAPAFFPVDSDLAIRHALAHRTELADQDDTIRRAEITVTEVDARDDFRGELTAFYNLTGISDSQLENPTLGEMVESSWEDLRRRPGNRGVRFSISVPIWDAGVNGNEVAAARVALQRQQLSLDNLRRNIVREVKAALANLDAAIRRYEVLERSLGVAERSFDISQQRFEAGDITSDALANDRDRLVQARRSMLDATVAYRLAVADLRRQTLYDFAVGRSLVVDEDS